MRIILSAAVTADGDLDDNTPQRLMISTAADWEAVQQVRASCDAILVGAETLRRDNPALRSAFIEFFTAADGHLGFLRSSTEKLSQRIEVYANRSGDPWEIPSGRILLGHNLETVAADALVLLPDGFCALEV